MFHLSSSHIRGPGRRRLVRWVGHQRGVAGDGQHGAQSTPAAVAAAVRPVLSASAHPPLPSAGKFGCPPRPFEPGPSFEQVCDTRRLASGPGYVPRDRSIFATV